MSETWIDLVYDDRYEISDQGRLRRKSNGRIRKPSITPSGYHVHVLSRPGEKHKGYYEHRAVIESFLGPCPVGKEVSHIDGNNQNNALSNLAYETAKENSSRKYGHGTLNIGDKNGSAVLTYEKVAEMKRVHAEGGSTYKQTASLFGVSTMTAYRAINGDSWRYRHKNGTEDLDKARWYEDKLRELEESDGPT